MPRPRPPTLVRLDPPGPYVTLTAQAFDMALGYPPGEGLPVRLVFVLSNGVALHIPATPETVDSIRDRLNQAFPDDAETNGESGS